MKRAQRRRRTPTTKIVARRGPVKGRKDDAKDIAGDKESPPPAERGRHPAPFPIVGIGASAGGIEALEPFFRRMPRASGMAFIVILHLDPQRESLLSAVIGRWTEMPVQAARNGDRVMPNKVFVIPANATLTIAEGRLRLQPRAPSEHMVIDSFFASLALDQGDNAICIVLSGTGTDGSLGLKSVKEHGGLTLAQGRDGEGARFPEMPDSAEATGLVDLVIPVQDMPARLVDFLGRAPDVRANEASPGEHRVALLRTLYGTLRSRVGHDFSRYKEKTFLRRVQRRMHVLQMQTLEEYADRLKGDPNEAPLLFRDLLIGVTNFFRDAEAFAELEHHIPRLFAGKGIDETLRAWVTGCATGEEAYSLAMLLREHAETLPNPPKIQIFATDIDENALGVARTGIYPAAVLQEVPRSRLKRFFTREGASYRVNKDVRDLCVFSAHSLIRDPPFSRLDLVSCRNLLIYLGTDLQTQVIPLFHYALRPGGILFLGTSENVSRHGDLFAALSKRWRIFERQSLVTRQDVPFPMLTNLGGARPEQRPTSLPILSVAEAGPSLELILRRIGAVVQENYGPAYVVTNAEGEVIHYSGHTGKYLEPAEGPPNRSLVAMARKGLRLDLRSALHRAQESGETVRRERIAVQVNGGSQFITLSVQPIVDNRETLYLVVFTDAGPMVREDDGKATRVPSGEEQSTVQHLERELQLTRERLQTTVEEFDTSSEELRSSNEELLSVNEELQSANEELETSKEEIQSINEELQTVNAEISSKVEELDRANTDLKNLFESTQIATIMLESDLTIRSFTPAIEAVFNLIPSDRGRPLTHMVSRLDQPHIERDIRAAMECGQPVERRVTSNDGRIHYLMRIIPFPSPGRKISGALITFVDVSNIIRAEEHEKRLLQELDHRVRNTLGTAMTIVETALRESDGLEDFAGRAPPRLAALARTHELVSQHNWTSVPLQALISTEVAPYLRLTSRRDVAMKGPDIALLPEAAMVIGWAIHELAMPVGRHGALAVKVDISVRWTIVAAKAGRKLELQWAERGTSSTADRKSQLAATEIKRRLRAELGATLQIDYGRSGLKATIRVALNRCIAGSAETPARRRKKAP